MKEKNPYLRTSHSNHFKKRYYLIFENYEIIEIENKEN
jgi:hypothetical protein